MKVNFYQNEIFSLCKKYLEEGLKVIIKKSLINKSIEYILQHIDEEISIEDVAITVIFQNIILVECLKQKQE